VWSLSPAETTALLLSLKVAFWSVAASLPVAVALAWILSRLSFPGKSLLDAIVHLPLVLPPVVVGYFLPLACAVMGLPLLVRAVRQSLDAVDRGLEAAAATLGAPPLWVFASVTLPLILPGILTGMLLSFARSLGEFGATITFVSNIPGETQTLPLAIYAFTQVPGGDAQALRLCILSIVLSLAALMASEVLVRRATVRAAGRDA